MLRKVEPIRYPERFAPQGQGIDLRPFPTISGSWDHARRRLITLSTELSAVLSELPKPDSYCVAIAGSFGRMEAAEDSDLDYMVLSVESLDTEIEQQIIDAIRKVATDSKISLPNPEDVFAQVT